MPDPAAVAETPVVQPDPSAPTLDEAMAALNAERQAHNMERQRAAQLEQETRNARAVAEQALLAHRGQPEPPKESAAGKLFEQGLVDPNAAGQNLYAMIEQVADRKAQERTAQIANMFSQRMAETQAQNNSAMAYNAFSVKYPDLASPDREAQLGGAIVQANLEAQRNNIPLAPAQMLDRAARIMRERNGQRQGQTPAFVEGASSPSLSQGIGLPSNEAPKQSEFERMYGMEPGFIQGLPTPEEMTDLTTKYVNEENAEKLKFGIPLTSVRLKAS